MKMTVQMKRTLAMIMAIAMVISCMIIDGSKMRSEASESLIRYSGHQQSYGNLAEVSDGAVLGVTGQAKRLEAVTIYKGKELEGLTGEIQCQVHVQSYGTMNWVNSGNSAGTQGKSKRLEAVRIRLTGEIAEKYDVYYATHCQKIGWTKWTKGIKNDEKNGGWCGTQGMSLRIEAIKIVLVPSGNGAPDSNGKSSYMSSDINGTVLYSGSQQTIGELSTVKNGQTLGVTGKSKRLESIKISLSDEDSDKGGIKYRAHVQGIGWQSWTSNGNIAGTKGQSKRLEAIEIALTGEISECFDVWYRVHIQGYGWMGWAKNGQTAGSTGIGYRIEAIEIKLVSKAGTAPGKNYGFYTNVKKIKDTGKMVAITFDDGPGARTGEILNMLERYGAHATFFVAGSNANRNKALLQRMDAIGCEIGNHTYNHKQLTKLSAAGIKSELAAVDNVVIAATGHKTTVMRPPYGAKNATVLGAVGKPAILWSIDTLDWKTRNTQSTINAVMSNVKDGDIILMHDIHSPTVDAALKLIPMLVNQGYTLVTVSELAAAKGVTLKSDGAYSAIR